MKIIPPIIVIAILLGIGLYWYVGQEAYSPEIYVERLVIIVGVFIGLFIIGMVIRFATRADRLCDKLDEISETQKEIVMHLSAFERDFR